MMKPLMSLIQQNPIKWEVSELELVLEKALEKVKAFLQI